MQPVINMRNDGLPLSSFADTPRWVTWKTMARGADLTKVPLSPLVDGERMAACDTPATWGTLAQAQAHHARTPGVDGVGICLGQYDDKWCIGGIDLDACRDPNSGALTSWAEDVLRMFRTMAEVSPSRTGAKAFFRYSASLLPALRRFMDGAQWGKNWRRPGTGGPHSPAIELHLGNRYFTVTGQRIEWLPEEIHLATYENILRLIRVIGPEFAGKPPLDDARTAPAPQPVTAAPAALPAPTTDAAALWGLIRAKSGFHPPLARLMAGDFSSLNDQSRSAKAMAMGRALAVAGFSREAAWTALQSWPHTAEWAQEKGAGGNGREFHRLWTKATTSDNDTDWSQAFGVTSLPVVVTADDIFKTYDIDEIIGMPPPEWLIEEIITTDGLAGFYGPPASLKSFVALGAALCIAYGLPWMGRKTKQTGVLYVAAEGVRGLGRRIRAWQKHHKMEGVHVPFRLLAATVNLTDPIQTAKLIRTAIAAAKEDGVEIGLVIIDTVARAMAGADENSSQDMGRFISGCDAIKQEVHCAVLGIHHSGKDEERGARGSSAFLGAMDTLARVKRSDDKETVTLTIEKQKEDDEGKPIVMSVIKIELSTGLKPESSLILVPQENAKTDAAKEAKARQETQELLFECAKALGPDGVLTINRLAEALGRPGGRAREAIKLAVPLAPDCAEIPTLEGIARLWRARQGAGETSPFIVRRKDM